MCGEASRQSYPQLEALFRRLLWVPQPWPLAALQKKSGARITLMFQQDTRRKEISEKSKVKRKAQTEKV